jgi:hypothetical protein
MDYKIEDFIVGKRGNEVVSIVFAKEICKGQGNYLLMDAEDIAEIKEMITSFDDRMNHPYYTGGEENCDVVYIIETSFGYKLCTRAEESGMLMVAIKEGRTIYMFDTEDGLL